MKDKIEKMKPISQTDVDCIMLTGKATKYVTKAQIVEAGIMYRNNFEDAAHNAEKSLSEISELAKELKKLHENQRREDFTEVPTEELNDVITDVRYISENLRKIVLDRVDNNHKADLLMDCFQAVERVHAFCISRANASIDTIKEYA